MSDRGLSLMTDLYELTMMQGYFDEGHNVPVVFDMLVVADIVVPFFRDCFAAYYTTLSGAVAIFSRY